MQSYRRGHNELDSKSSCPNRHVGSNPTDCAIVQIKLLKGSFFMDQEKLKEETKEIKRQTRAHKLLSRVYSKYGWILDSKIC